MNYDLSRAVAILRAAHAEMVTGRRKKRPAAMADLELAGVKTGAVRVAPAKRKRAKAA